MKIKEQLFFNYIRDYLTVYLVRQRDVSPLTVKSYREVLRMYLDFLCSSQNKQLYDISFEDITSKSISDFLDWLTAVKQCSGRSRNHHLAIIRAFLKYVGIRDATMNSLYMSAQKIPFVKTEKKLIVDHFDEAALEAILRQPDATTRRGHRDLFFMILMYDTGARDFEMLSLCPSDIVIDKKTSYVYIRGKGKKIRTVPITKATTEHYQSYLKRFHDGNKLSNKPLFYTTIHNERHPMSDDNVARFINKYAKKAQLQCNSVPDRVTPHMFRHSRALNLYRSGVPLPLISELLGHSDLSTTLIYAYADTEMKRLAIEKATDANHPLNNVQQDGKHTYTDEELQKLYGLKG